MDSSHNSPPTASEVPAAHQEKRPGIGLAVATVLAVAATLIVNILSNIFPPGGENVGEIATTLLGGVLIIPASYAFAIWGLIYLGLIAYAIYQFQPSQRSSPTFRRVDWLLIIACLSQVAWIFLFTLKFFGISILAMLGILLPLIGIYLTLDINLIPVSRSRRWQAQLPFSVYLGWISVATIVNVAAALYSAGWLGWGLGDSIWTVVMLIVGAVVATLVLFRRRDIALPLVFVWAYVAIALKQTAYPAVWATAALLAIVLAGLVFYRRRGG